MPHDLVIIEEFDNPHRADMARMLLEENGIPAMLDNRYIVETAGFPRNAVGNIRLQVPADQADAARALLADQNTSIQTRRARAGDFESSVCLNCGQPMTDDQDVCPHCGWTFVGGEE
jgi:Putative prokaryotic signal transducing protein